MKNNKKKNNIRILAISVIILSSLFMGCASMRYGQVPCPCQNSGRK